MKIFNFGFFFIFLATTLFFSCSKENPPSPEIHPNETNTEQEIDYDNQSVVFIRRLVETEEECNQLRANSSFISCYHSLTLVSDSIASLLITDIQEVVYYRIENNHLIVSFQQVYENPIENMVFEIKNDNELLLLRDNTIWQKRNGESLWD